jgi:hypothetical protein
VGGDRGGMSPDNAKTVAKCKVFVGPGKADGRQTPYVQRPINRSLPNPLPPDDSLNNAFHA